MTSALEVVNKAVSTDATEERDARNYLDNVRKVGAANVTCSAKLCDSVIRRLTFNYESLFYIYLYINIY